jgi:hypothetical protein
VHIFLLAVALLLSVPARVESPITSPADGRDGITGFVNYIPLLRMLRCTRSRRMLVSTPNVSA